MRSPLVASTMEKNTIGKVPQNLKNHVFFEPEIQKFSGGEPPKPPSAYATVACVACNCGDLFNDRGISIKLEKHA